MPHTVELITSYPFGPVANVKQVTHEARCECGRSFSSTCYVDVISWAEAHVHERI